MLDATQTDFDNIQIQSDELWATIHSTPEKCNNRHWQPKWTPELLHTKLAAVMRLTWKKKQKKQQQRWKKKNNNQIDFHFVFGLVRSIAIDATELLAVFGCSVLSFIFCLHRNRSESVTDFVHQITKFMFSN